LLRSCSRAHPGYQLGENGQALGQRWFGSRNLRGPRLKGAFCFLQVDIGAGVGFFSLAAAARGHRSLAFETSPKHLRALRTSVARNRFQELITVRPVQVGASSPSFCATWNMRVEVKRSSPTAPRPTRWLSG
jgi:hypothetical protein